MIENLKLKVSAPGKIILSGEHSVVFGEPAIAATISLKSNCVLSTTSDGLITINLESYDFKHCFTVDQLNQLIGIDLKVNQNEFSLKHTDQLKAVNITELKSFQPYKQIHQIAPSTEIENALILIYFIFHSMCQSVNIHVNQGVTLNISTELTIGAGSGSSASFAVCVAASVFTYIKYSCFEVFGKNTDKNISKEGFKHCTLNLSCFNQFDKEDKEIINQYAFLAEKITHGKPSGLDNTICTYGSMVKLQSRPEGSEIEILRDIYQLDVLLVDTRVQRSTGSLVQKVSELKKRHEEVLATILNAMGTVTNSFLKVLTSLASLERSNVDNKKMLIDNDIQKLEDLVDVNQGLLFSLGVSHPSLNEIIEICKRYNLHAKLTGAGGGGYAFAVIPPFYDRDVLDQCIAVLVDKGYGTYKDIKLGGPGLELEVLRA